MLITTFAVFLAVSTHPSIHAFKKPRDGSGASRASRVELITYHGWNQAYRITNGIADVVVVPGIGRIMSYSLTGHPETDPIWNNPDEFGKSPSTRGEWSNFGGDKTWPNPQSDWEKHMKVGGAWPPDPAFDSGPSKIARIPNGVRLTNPVSANFNLQLTRDITLRPGQSDVTITDTFYRPASDPTNEARMPVGLWNVTQTRSDATVFLPLGKTGCAYFPLDGSGKAGQANWKASNGILTVTHSAIKSTKVGAFDSNGWLAALYAGNIVFAERFSCLRRGPYLDSGANAEVYTNPRPSYIEMETLGPGSVIAPGRSITRTVTWTLKRLPKKPRSAAEARTVISRSLAGH